MRKRKCHEDFTLAHRLPGRCAAGDVGVKLNADGTFDVYFGSREACGGVPNRLDVTEGWNFLMRIYRPGRSVLDGAYKLPEVRPVQ